MAPPCLPLQKRHCLFNYQNELVSPDEFVSLASRDICQGTENNERQLLCESWRSLLVWKTKPLMLRLR